MKLATDKETPTTIEARLTGLLDQIGGRDVNAEAGQSLIEQLAGPPAVSPTAEFQWQGGAAGGGDERRTPAFSEVVGPDRRIQRGSGSWMVRRPHLDA